MKKEDHFQAVIQMCERQVNSVFAQDINENNLAEKLREVEINLLNEMGKLGYLIVLEQTKSKKKIVYISKNFFSLTKIKELKDIFNWHKYIEDNVLGNFEKASKNFLYEKFEFYIYLRNIRTFFVSKRNYIVDGRKYECFFTIDTTEAETIKKEKYKNKLQRILFNDIFKKANISIVITNTAGQIVYVNEFFKEVTGYSFDELKGENPRILKSGETSLYNYIEMWENLSSGKPWEGVFVNLKKNRSKYYEKAVVHPLYSQTNKNIINYIGFKILISEDFLSNQEVKTKNLPFEIISYAKLGYLLLNTEGRIIALNDVFLYFFSLKKEQTLFQKICEIKDNEIKRLTKIYRITKSIRKFHSIIRIEKSNKYFEVVSHKTKEKEILLIFKDITKLKKSEERVQAKSFKLYEIIDFVKIAIFSINTSGIIINANETAQKMLGFEHEQIKNKFFFDFFKDSSISDFLKKEIFNVEIKNLETEFLSVGNNSIIVEINTKITYNVLNHKIILVQLRDITQERKEKEYLKKIIAEKTIELSLALKKEQQLNQMKTDFISITSHEFRTPLATIGFTTEFIKRHKDKMSEEQYQAKIQKILSQTKFMEKLLDDMMLLGKFNSDKVVVKKQNISISEFLREMIKEFETIYPDFTFRLVNSAENDLVELDIKIGQSIFQNLMSNAVKYSSEKKEVIIKLLNPDKISIIIEVKDFGIGIPAEYKDSVFDNFVRVPNVSYIQGTGLGLSIVKKSVEAHNGNIFFTSEEGVGTSFFVSLPLTYKKNDNNK